MTLQLFGSICHCHHAKREELLTDHKTLHGGQWEDQPKEQRQNRRPPITCTPVSSPLEEE